MEPVRIEKKNTRIIAHRGLSGIERENTVAAFVAAGNRSYYGIETDVHRTADGGYILIHDGRTGRVADRDIEVENATLAELRSLHLTDKAGRARGDLILPLPQEYFSVCKCYDKVSVLELKGSFNAKDLSEIIEQAQSLDQLEHTVFISFSFENLVELRKLLPNHPVQFLTDRPVDSEWIGQLAAEGFDLDIREDRLTPESVAALKAAGIKINCWTVDRPERAAELVEMGVDYLTTNILE
ncbi:MAG: glycerophosphodiester phosphodiesterase family protein [Eubacteriales bacterium]